MKKYLPWLIGLVVGAALGISGTYAVDRFTGGESPPCAAWSGYLNDWPLSDQSTVPNNVRYRVGYYPTNFLDYWDKLLTIRNKACQ